MTRFLGILVLLLIAVGIAGGVEGKPLTPPCPSACPPTPCTDKTCGTPVATPCPSSDCGTPVATPCPAACATPTAIRDLPDYTGSVEYQLLDDGPPHLAARMKPDDSPWFGAAGQRVYLSWQDGDAEAVIYLPPLACQWVPGSNCHSSCPPQFSCFVGVSTYRDTDARWPVLVLEEVPFYAGPAQSAVIMHNPGDGTVRWELPPQALPPPRK